MWSQIRLLPFLWLIPVYLILSDVRLLHFGRVCDWLLHPHTFSGWNNSLLQHCSYVQCCNAGLRDRLIMGAEKPSLPPHWRVLLCQWAGSTQHFWAQVWAWAQVHTFLVATRQEWQPALKASGKKSLRANIPLKRQVKAPTCSEGGWLLLSLSTTKPRSQSFSREDLVSQKECCIISPSIFIISLNLKKICNLLDEICHSYFLPRTALKQSLINSV